MGNTWRNLHQKQGKKNKERALNVLDKHNLEKFGKKERKYWNVRASMLYVPSCAGKHGRSRRKRDALGRHNIHSIFKGLFSCSLNLTNEFKSWGKSQKPPVGLLPASPLSCLPKEVSRVLVLSLYHNDRGGRAISLGGVSWVSSHLNQPWFPEQPPAPRAAVESCLWGAPAFPLKKLRKGRL